MPRSPRLTALTTLLALVLLGGMLTAPPTQADGSDLGTITKKSRLLKRGCHDYGFRYSVRPPPGDWGLEVFVINRDSGVGVNSTAVVGGMEPTTGRRHFRLCRPSSKPGRYVIRGLLSVQNGFDYDEWWIEPEHFRFYKKRRR